jgi:glycosyltransferase 2 family protein
MAEPTRERARWPWMAVRAAFSCGALLWVLHVAPLHTVVAPLRSAYLPLLIAGIAISLLARLAAAERTLVIGRALGLFVNRWQTIETLFISNFYALLSPGPVLSGVVTVYRYRRFGASMTGSIGSLLASRAVECAAFIALGTVCVLMDKRVVLASVQYPLSLAVAALLMIGVGMACWWLLHKRWLRRVHQERTSPAGDGLFARLREAWHEVMHSGPRMLWHAAIPATVQVVLSGASISVIASSLGIGLSLITAIWLSAAVYAVVLLPISVAGLGVREVTLVNALGLVGVSPRLAVALSLLTFVDPLVNAVIGGFLQFGSAIRGIQKLA